MFNTTARSGRYFGVISTPMATTAHPAEHTSEQVRDSKVAERQRLEEKRCDNCNQLLMNHKIVSGTAEIKCHKCGYMNRVTGGLTNK